MASKNPFLPGYDKPCAHSPSKKNPVWHGLADHLTEVGELAAVFASFFGANEEGHLAGLLHDIGKYGSLFQQRLRGAKLHIDHWSAGAWTAAIHYRSIAAAIAIQGHHLGLQRLDQDSLRSLSPEKLAANHPLGLKLSENNLELLLEHFRADGLSCTAPAAPPLDLAAAASVMLDIRMLFSTLVDADFINTAAHFDPTRPKKPQDVPLHSEQALDVLLSHIESLRSSSNAADHINALRAELLDSCLAAAVSPPGLWTLSAPTGAGKTLAMLAFALKHAAEHDLRRIVVVIPYLSIIEQTARTYREVLCPHFGEDYILEHHSMAGTKPLEASEGVDTDDHTGRQDSLLAENWDAPLIVTTSVQFLESLFSNRPSACRKLHRLAKSVVLFDEVQTLPIHLTIPTLATLSHLSERYGSSVVFSTATQPAFPHLDENVRKLSGSGWRPREIAPVSLNLFDRVQRTRVTWPEQDRRHTWQEIASCMAQLPQVLTIVNIRRHAQTLAMILADQGVDGLFHLSTAMCPAHRKSVLNEVRRRLSGRVPVRLVSTQCVEAGVDIDFPVVYRAFGPLEAIAQAAGRCNRHGTLPFGEVRVFVPEDNRYPCGGGYEQAASVTQILLKSRGASGICLDEPTLFREYYKRLYDLTRPENHKPELIDAINCRDFVEVAKRYRVIDGDMINILTPYDPMAYQELRDAVDKCYLSAAWMRRAQPYTVSVYRPQSNDSIWGAIIPVPINWKETSNDWFLYERSDGYHEYFGLLPENGPAIWFV